MINTQTTPQTNNQERNRVNVAFKITGWLGHDNKLFDATCPQCGGMFSSYETRNCPKCNAALTSLTTSDGKSMAISEGTIYPAFGKKTKENWLKSTQARKNGMEVVYRFKVFSFADTNGVLTPPAGHHEFKKGAMVEIMTLNHPPVASWFQDKEGKPKVELMFGIFPHYNDTVKVLKAPQVADATITYPVNQDGTPAPVTPPYQPAPQGTDEAAALKQEIAQLKALIAQQQGANTPAQTANNNSVEATLQEVDPFNAAS